MLPRRFAALSVLALVLFGLGLFAFVLPDPYQGPLLMQWASAADAGATAAVNALGPALYMADALGLLLLALALIVVWAMAVSWEQRRRRAAEAEAEADAS